MMSLVHTSANANFDSSDEAKLRGSKKSSRISNKMFFIGRELCFLLLIVFTTYASFNSSSSFGSGPIPTPFFPKGSLVGDFFKGDLADALLRASEGDISFIMYYAPWDAESQATRPHFEAVAHQLYKQVYFAGINCWLPRGDCKRTLSKIQQFPKLVVYVTHETGIEYHGPRTEQYMTAFLQSVMHPLNRLTTPIDLAHLRYDYNAVLVAYLNFSGPHGGSPYRALYETALHYLERDVRQEIAFAVVTSSKTARDMGAEHTPSVKLFLWNETLDYSGPWTASGLTQWLSTHLHQVSLWLSPPGIKSFTLAPYLSHGPALLMFTPLNNFVMYNLLREVGLEYHNCLNRTDVTQLAQNISIHVSERISRIRRTMMTCQSRSHDLVPTVQIVNTVWANISCHKGKELTQYQGQWCSKVMPGVGSSKHQSLLLELWDPLSAASLSDWVWRESCEHLVAPPPRLLTTPLAPTLRGLACRHNTSVSLLALDSSLFAHFAKGLGVDPTDTTKVILLNSKMETTHSLDETITRTSLSQFLVNFTEGRLDRFQRNQFSSSTVHPSISPLTTAVSVTELSQNTFLSVTFNDSQNVVVLFHTPYCAFCRAVNHVYLTAARLLRGVPSLVFARLDGEKNDLPWQFTVPYYPSILFFPARRKAESRVLAARVGITVDSLTQFVLSNLPLELRLLAMLQLCHNYPITQDWPRRRECLVNLRREVLEAVSANLSAYRAFSLRQTPSHYKHLVLTKMLKRLQHLRQLQFSLGLNSARSVQLSESLLALATETLPQPHDEL